MSEENCYLMLEKYIRDKTPELDAVDLIRQNETFCVKTKKGIGAEYTRHGRVNDMYL